MSLAPATAQDSLASRLAIARARISRHAQVAGIASGMLLWASFPPLEWSGLAWVALAPLFWLVTLARDSVQGVSGGLAGRPGLLAAGPAVADAARRRRIDRLGRHVAGLFRVVAPLPVCRAPRRSFDCASR